MSEICPTCGNDYKSVGIHWGHSPEHRPSNYNETEREDYSSLNCGATFTKEQSNELFEYMGSPLPDFGYKFPNNEVC
jgi:hypothetical protein